MKYAVEMVSGAIIYIPIFIKIQAFKSQFGGNTDTLTHRKHSDLINQFFFFSKYRN
jgi:hypothetical protein